MTYTHRCIWPDAAHMSVNLHMVGSSEYVRYAGCYFKKEQLVDCAQRQRIRSVQAFGSEVVSSQMMLPQGGAGLPGSSIRRDWESKKTQRFHLQRYRPHQTPPRPETLVSSPPQGRRGTWYSPVFSTAEAPAKKTAGSSRGSQDTRLERWTARTGKHRTKKRTGRREAFNGKFDVTPSPPPATAKCDARIYLGNRRLATC